MSLPCVRMTWRNEHPRLRPSLAVVARAITRAIPQGRGKRPRVDVVVSDDRTIAALSGQFRGERHATDVLSFGYGDSDLYGEILISLDTASKQARARGQSLEAELTLLAIHGLLHVAGQGDETRKAWCAMRVSEFSSLVRVLSPQLLTSGRSGVRRRRRRGGR